MPLLIAAVITAVAAGAAFAVNTVIGSMVAPEGEIAGVEAAAERAVTSAAPTAAQSAGARGKGESTYMNGILCRNIFDPESLSSCEERIKKSGGGGGGQPGLSDLDVTLVGTMVARPAKFSVAFIQVEDGDAGSYGIDDKLLDAVVTAIAERKVTVRRNGREEHIVMDEEAPPERPKRSASTAGTGSEEEGIEKVGDNKFVVSRDLLDKYINDIESISRMGRALLHRGPDGEFDGYRLSAIRRNTLADKLGIRNGDVVHSVNGKPLNSVQSAMEAYQTMMNDNNFNFEVTRRGQKVQLDYEVE